MSDILADSSFELDSDYSDEDSDYLEENSNHLEENSDYLEKDSNSSEIMIIFLLIVASAILTGALRVRTNASPIVKKFSVTMVNPEEVYNFSKQKKQKMMNDVKIGKEEFNKFMKISERRKRIEKVTDIYKIPANLKDKFVPDYSRFEGVDEFLQKTQTNGTIVEDYLYHTTPRFRIDDEGASHKYFVMIDTLKIVDDFRIEDCEKFSESCHNLRWFMKNGNLIIDETFVLKSKEYKFTRVYFIPPHKMI